MPKLEAYSKNLDYSYALGIYPAMNLINARPECVRRLLIASGAEGSDGVSKLRAACRAAGVREEPADKALSRIARKDNCFAALVFEKYACALKDSAAHVVLCQVSDAGNLGSILRTCLGFGVKDVAIIRPCVDVFDPHAVRASMGAFFHLNVRVYDSFDDYRAEFPSRPLYPFMLGGAVAIQDAPREKKFSLVFGNEQSGLPDAFQDMGTPVYIPQSEKIDSLNLAAAVAVGVFAFVK